MQGITAVNGAAQVHVAWLHLLHILNHKSCISNVKLLSETPNMTEFITYKNNGRLRLINYTKCYKIEQRNQQPCKRTCHMNFKLFTLNQLQLC